MQAKISMFITTKDLPDFNIIAGYTAKLIHTDQLTVMHVTVAAGATLPEHQHPHEQITNVISGEFEMTVAGVTKICRAGDSIVTPGNTPHSGIALTDCKLIDVFNPPREDYK